MKKRRVLRVRGTEAGGAERGWAWVGEKLG